MSTGLGNMAGSARRLLHAVGIQNLLQWAAVETTIPLFADLQVVPQLLMEDRLARASQGDMSPPGKNLCKAGRFRILIPKLRALSEVAGNDFSVQTRIGAGLLRQVPTFDYGKCAV